MKIFLAHSMNVSLIVCLVNAAPATNKQQDSATKPFHSDPGRSVVQKCVFDFYTSVSNVLDEAEGRKFPVTNVSDEFKERLNILVEKASFRYKTNAGWHAMTRDNGTREISNSHTELIYIAQNFFNIIAQDIRKEQGSVSLNQKEILRKLCSTLNSARNDFICCIHDPYLSQRQCQKQNTRASFDGCEMCDVCTGCR